MAQKREPWHPPTYEPEDVIAVQAVTRYAAELTDTPPSQAQCKRMLDWLIETACSTYDDPFRPNREDVRTYMLGRRSVGLALIKLMKLNLETIRKAEDDRRK